MLIDGLGLWFEDSMKVDPAKKGALFLDRDGVVVEDVHFLSHPKDIKIIDGVPQAIAQANCLEVPVILVTNQSGIARGLFSWSDFESVQQAIKEELSRDRAHVDATLACGYHIDGIGALARKHVWRKPSPGMIKESQQRFHLTLKNSFIVGDRLTDLEAGKEAGLSSGALVSTGYGGSELIKFEKASERWVNEDKYTALTFDTAEGAIENWLKKTERSSFL